MFFTINFFLSKPITHVYIADYHTYIYREMIRFYLIVKAFFNIIQLIFFKGHNKIFITLKNLQITCFTQYIKYNNKNLENLFNIFKHD